MLNIFTFKFFYAFDYKVKSYERVLHVSFLFQIMIVLGVVLQDESRFQKLEVKSAKAAGYFLEEKLLIEE